MKGEFYRMEYEAWDEGTDALTLEQEAAYLRLCHQMYRRRGAIPDTPATLARIWRCHPNKARKLLDDLLGAGKVTRTPEGLTNMRVTRELDARGIISTQRADAGRTGGIRSGESRRKSLELHDPPEADASSLSMREEKRREELLAQQRARDLLPKLKEAAGLSASKSKALDEPGVIADLLLNGFSVEAHILPALRAVAEKGRKGLTWGYYLGAIKDEREKAEREAPSKVTVPMVKVARDSPEGRAWDEHALTTEGRPLKWFEKLGGDPARSFPSRWPPGHGPPTEAAA